ncbi:hypothetical protein TrLO_g1126 [Triparma laevis f. longispina]|uniref:ATP-dependent RNA helicase Ski2/MTR4 C-terminal domain-containing protein n=1 Tax=Triparma laevis f. longispina TaxID=1714387 RepID=A0A9W7C8R7_9STRA|nr:hypothetical protein TrLO_g1126 [Triparma laevis f. longispina]
MTKASEYNEERTRSSKSKHILEVEKIVKALFSDPKPVFDFKEARKGDMEASNATAKLTELTMMLETFDFHMEPSLSGFVQAQETWELENEVQRLKHLTSDEALALYPDFIAKRNVLVDMGYLEEENVATLKGRACVNINTCEESIMLTEIIFQGLLDELNPMEIAAVLTAVIFQERRVTVDLEGEGLGKLKFACERVKEVCRAIGVQLRSSGLPIDPDQYVEDNLKFGLAHVAHAWACGLPFVEICNLTEVLEGSIVRTLNRLDEVLREVQHVCRVTGDAKLHLKCEEASMLIKRDVCFSPSLYLS